MNTKNRFFIITSMLTLIISIVALIIGAIAFWSSCTFEFDKENAIMSAFSVIVAILIGAMAILIGLLAYNHYIAKDEVKNMINEEIPKIASEIWNGLESINIATNDTCLISTRVEDYNKIEAYIRGIETAKNCKSEKMKEYAINDILERFHRFLKNLKEEDGKHILKGKRNDYFYVCDGIRHKYIQDLKDYIKDAEEVNT